MRWMLLIAVAAIAATFWLPGEAAQPAATATAGATAAGNDANITFAQYRDWRNDFTARRRSALAAQLSQRDLPAAQKTRLTQVKAYYGWLAGLSEADRDRRYRLRFDQIDTDHDGTMDRAERAAWHDKRRALYRNDRVAQAPTAAPLPAK